MRVKHLAPRVSIQGVDETLGSELAAALVANGCDLTPHALPDLVFCSAEPGTLDLTLRNHPRCPVVVVTRLPDASAWLDALEAGATDYCAAPFETVQIRWLLDSHLKGWRQATAAA